MSPDERHKRIVANLERSILNLTIAVGLPVLGPPQGNDDEASATPTTTTTSGAPSIRATFVRYMHENSHRRRASQQQIEHTVERFLKVASITWESSISVINKGHVVAFKNHLIEVESLSLTTVNRLLTLLNHFVVWCRNQDYLTIVPTEGTKVSARAQRAGALIRQAFSMEQVLTLLNSPWLLKRRHPTDDRRLGSNTARESYWVVVICAFTGMRVGEVLPICVDSIKREESSDILYTDLHEDKERGMLLKNQSSIRKVVLHSALLKTGFLDYVAERKKVGPMVQLFPSLKTRSLSSVPGFFRRLMTALGMTQKNLSLHSLRHAVATELVKAGCVSEIRHYPDIHYQRVSRTSGMCI